ncbi:MAG: hypothetical protein ACOY46_00445 [Bacillota bacterium]
MGGCSGHSEGQGSGTCSTLGGRSEIEKLVKAFSIEEANRLIKEGHVFIAVYWNCEKSREEYILGKQKKDKAPLRKVGFSVN